MRSLCIALSLVLLCSCSEDETRDEIVRSNPGFRTDLHRLVRWPTPIAVNTSGIARADEAIEQIEQSMHGAVTFKKVKMIPENGIAFVEGGAMNGDGSPGCGHVSGGKPGQVQVNFRYDDNGHLTGTYYIHLGSNHCIDSSKGKRRSAVAEHETIHALGVATHFEKFTGNEGVMPPNVQAVLYNLYRNAIGSTEQELKIVSLPKQ